MEVYDAFPGSGGTLLRSANFNPLANAFAGGEFTSLSLTANDTYFIGFKNVGGLLANVTGDAGATELPGGLRYSFDNNGTYILAESGLTAQPILQFLGAETGSPIPEPASALTTAGLLASGLLLRLRIKSRV